MPQSFTRRSAEYLNEEERRADFLRLLRKGLSYREIEEETGWSRTEVGEQFKVIMRQLWATMADDLTVYVVQELERLEFMWERIRPRMERTDSDGKPDPDLKAMEIALKLSKRKSELLGLDRSAQAAEKQNDGLQRALTQGELQDKLAGWMARVTMHAALPPMQQEVLPPGTVTIEEADE